MLIAGIPDRFLQAKDGTPLQLKRHRWGELHSSRMRHFSMLWNKRFEKKLRLL